MGEIIQVFSINIGIVTGDIKLFRVILYNKEMRRTSF